MGMKRNRIGSANAKGGQRSRLRSIPKKDDSQHLDLYVLTKEKERLEQYKASLERSEKKVKVNVEQIDKRIAEVVALLEKATRANQARLSREKRKKNAAPNKSVMIIDY